MKPVLTIVSLAITLALSALSAQASRFPGPPSPNTTGGSFQIRNLCDKSVEYTVTYQNPSGRMVSRSRTLKPRQYSGRYPTTSLRPQLQANTVTQSDFWDERLYVKGGDFIIHSLGKNCY